MTSALKPIISNLGFDTTNYTYLTAPSGVPSINNEADALISADACLPSILPYLQTHDAVLICCYSSHPLVPLLRSQLATTPFRTRFVAGIFESSVSTCLSVLSNNAKFAIVSTGSQWEGILDAAVADLLGAEGSGRYAGTATTGLNADELHVTPKTEVDARMKAATRVVLERGAKAICLGCAGMVGLDDVVREACVEVLGPGEGGRVRIVDGVAAGVAVLEGLLGTGL
ncbi:hypothetical protein LTR62_002014 [Meristemomyces frigidus]|uniref:Hydantoin racemase n=1 Tax=Meristemomyces frigidus TaxID=1508187 RepID=A0AAN7YSC1_9PEZI|nr:hypothetical protein LTR62_002014 [Meristemomyces frigidus]